MGHPEYIGNEVCKICNKPVEPYWPQPAGAGTSIPYVWVHCFRNNDHAADPVSPREDKAVELSYSAENLVYFFKVCHRRNTVDSNVLDFAEKTLNMI